MSEDDDDLVKVVAKVLRHLDWEHSAPLNVHDDAEVIARTVITVVRQQATDATR